MVLQTGLKTAFTPFVGQFKEGGVLVPTLQESEYALHAMIV